MRLCHYPLLIAVLGLSACLRDPDLKPGADLPAAAEQTRTLAILGELTYGQRIALPPDTDAVVRLMDMSDTDGKLVAEERIELQGRQEPVPFELIVDRSLLDASRSYRLRGALLSGARRIWISDAVPVDVTGDRIELGTLTMTPVQEQEQFRATGNEPFWRLNIGTDEMTLITDLGRSRVSMATPPAEVVGGTTRYSAEARGRRMTVTITNELCADSMSGMPYPYRVGIVLDGRKLGGCGGDPASLLKGGEWSVVEINGTSPVTGTPVTLNFDGDGRVSGRGPCNAFTGVYLLTGEGLTISQLAGTMMMCEQPLMDLERPFLDLLAGTTRFEFATGGELVLHAQDERTLRARRTTP